MTVERQPSTIAQAVGDRISQRRREVSITAEAAAQGLGMSLADYMAAEGGESDFSAEQIVELCTMLQVQPSWVFEAVVSRRNAVDDAALRSRRDLS